MTLVLLRPLTTVTESSAGLTVMTGNLSAGEADDHVDVVAGLDDRADAGDLVDLDRDRSACRGRALDVEDRALRAAAEGVGGDLRAGGDGLARDLADDLRGVRERAGQDRGQVLGLVLHVGRP